MGNNTLGQKLQELKETLAPMSWKERLDHLWTYYKLMLIPVIAVVALLAVVITGIGNRQAQNLFSGALVNLTVTEEGKNYLEQDMLQALDLETKGDRASLMHVTFADLSIDPYSAQAAMQITAAVGAQTLDYALMDQLAIDYYVNHYVFAPLEELLEEEELAALEGRLLMHTDKEDGTVYAAAVDVSDLPLVQKFFPTAETVYLAFPGNTGRNDQAKAFLQLLLSGTEE